VLKQMRQATRSFPDGGIILAQGNEIVTMNRVAEGLLGLKRKQDRGVRIENLVRDPDFVDFLRTAEDTGTVEIVSSVQSGRWLEFTLTAYGPNQKLILVRDVTQQHKADEMRRDFVADDPGLSADLQRPIKEMQRQSERMRALVNELLRLSELESDGRAPDNQQVNLSAVMNTARQEARAAEGCPETVDVEISSPSSLLGDEADIQSVVSNLVSNAVRYTPPEGRIVIRWETDEKGGHLSVTDTGSGIASEHIPRLTERFYRVEDGRERMGGEGGNGLGLAIVKHALNRHDATLDVSSELGKGSRFVCHFPKQRIATVS
jgi:two-component system phosphate regulon sensor histidine kinase PhoR